MIKEEEKALVAVEGLQKYFTVREGFFHHRESLLKAVDGVSFQIFPGDTFALVGESGCGKTTVGRTILRLYESSGGKILYGGCDISSFNEKQLLPYRKRMQMVFQDPYASLNPKMTVSEILGEALDIHRNVLGSQRNPKINQLLELVGLYPGHAQRYPHEFSGGQRQRIGIARALAVEPEFLICDEPTSSLDVSIRAQIINLLQDLQVELGLTYLFITHDLSIVRHISNRIGVMYLGKLVELSSTSELFHNPLHPYTKALFSGIPLVNPSLVSSKKRVLLPGEPSSPYNPPNGCLFSPRCSYSRIACEESSPNWEELWPGHMIACHRVAEIN